MELIYLAHILGRHIWKILGISILVALLTFGYVKYVMPPEFKDTIVFSTTTKVDPERLKDNNYDPLSYFDAADRFSEAIIGWFRSPTLFEDLKAKAPLAKDLPLDAIIKVRKQEKQNVNILFSASNKEVVEQLDTAMTEYLKERVARVNAAGNTSYDLVDFQSIIETSKPSAPLAAGAAGGVLFVLLCLIALLWDLARGVILYPQQAEEILGTTALGNGKDQGDMAALAAFIAKQSTPVAIVQTASRKQNLALELARKTSDLLSRKTLLLDGAQHSTVILEEAGVGKRLAKVKGFFDKLGGEDLAHVAMPLVPEQPLLRFIGSGEGSVPATSSLGKLRDSNDVVLLHTTLPENPYILMEKDILLIVLVTPGQTRQKTLRHIARISEAPRTLFFA